jgi:hypothetical protein
MAIQFTENGMYGLSVGGVPNSNITNNELVDSTIGPEQLAYAAAGSIIGVNAFMDSSSNISLSSNQFGTVLFTSFTRLRTDSYIWAYGFTSLAGSSSNRCGSYISLNNTIKFEATHEFAPPSANGTDARRGHLLFNGVWTPDELRETTSINVVVGWKAGNNDDNRPAEYANPENLSSRARKHGTSILFFEMYDKPKFSSEDNDAPGMGMGQ